MKVMATIIITTMIEEEQPFFIIIRHQCLFVQSFLFDLVTTKNLFILLFYLPASCLLENRGKSINLN